MVDRKKVLKQAGIAHNIKITVNQLKLLYPYCAFHTKKKEMHSRDATVLIDLLWFNVQLVSVFFSLVYYGLYSSWKFLIFSVLIKTCNTLNCYSTYIAHFISMNSKTENIPCMHAISDYCMICSCKICYHIIDYSNGTSESITFIFK